jgi:hypothetical protein
MGVIWTDKMEQRIREEAANLCECGHWKAQHSTTDSVDDPYGNFAGTRNTCDHAEWCGCTGFWN